VNREGVNRTYAFSSNDEGRGALLIGIVDRDLELILEVDEEIRAGNLPVLGKGLEEKTRICSSRIGYTE